MGFLTEFTGLNYILTAASGAVAGVIVGSTALWLYFRIAPIRRVGRFLCWAVNLFAYRGNRELEKSNVPKRLKDQIRKDLDELGDHMDDAWDAGWNGMRYKDDRGD